ncbi:MAG: Ferric-pseudobactin 358 receptor [Luteibacter sp.]|uniref:TonB-dependent receptor n=1 Tax=Luteibacter sp. TaxID=1886636 RepID=UPI0013837AA0|nr:TonB-dependent receptor [Luteibacter sp.]KAF1005922.1 MAG: Ferric-pseudobactin 358 receptor [Luteibacter sp.]
MSAPSTITRSSASLPTMLAAAILLALGTVATTRAQEAPASNQAARHPVDIPAQSLPRALATLSSQTRLQVIYSDEAPYGVQAPALKGDYTDTEALDRLLQGSGLRWRQVSPGVVTLEKAAAGSKGDVVTGTLSVESAYGDHPTGDARDRRGYDDVYGNDFSSVYKGRKDIERYRGNNPADLLKGMVNVYSGDARNSGALDPSIRGVEGPGRVPVLIDGTEQALTVWRGYNGANNRAYIDPSLIGGMQVLKGPTTARDVNGGIGGAVVVKTLDVDDVLAPGRTIGVDIRAEGANNSTSPRFPTLLTCQDYRNVPNFPGTPGAPAGTSPNASYGDPTVRQVPRKDPQTLSMGDRAYRVAFAAKQDDFDYLTAYAYRKRGNYFSGKNDASYYSHQDLYGMNNVVRQLGTAYEPGSEVPNTSSELQSWLGKITWHISPDQSLQLGARDTMSRYGEIMPSRIILGGISNLGAVQWPESKVDAKAYNLEYRWNPDSPWLDLYANAWTTRTASHTYTAGGFPNYAPGPSDPILRNTALANAQNNRVGLTLSNRMHFGERVDFTVGGHWEHEKLSSSDVWNGTDDGWRQFPRAGRRQEYDIHFDVQWRATDALTLEGGMRYSGYKAHDDFLAAQIRAGKGDYFTTQYRDKKQLTYDTIETTPDKYVESMRKMLTDSGLSGADLDNLLDIFRQQQEGQTYNFTNTVDWLPDANGRYHRADDICVNGFLSSVKNYAPGTCQTSNDLPAPQQIAARAKSQRGHGWAPWFSASYQFTPNSRAYLRYVQAYRFPSLFESTIGFSASIDPLNSLKPEHAYTWEAGYVHDLRDLFHLDSDQRADVKLTWFNTITRNVIERSDKLMFTNMNRKIVRGFELQGRYDNGRFFTDLGIAKTTTDKTCDDNRAILSDPSHGNVPNCVNYGFVSSYLLTQATPKFSANLTLGARFFDRALEVGTRTVYYRAYSNPQLDKYVTTGTISGYGLNVPYTWGTIVTYDAYADYKLHNGMTLELAGTNLGNRYYVDPLTRSLMPAPGRTIRLSVNARF